MPPVFPIYLTRGVHIKYQSVKLGKLGKMNRSYCNDCRVFAQSADIRE